ncbi:MAG: helix-turn-helix domain-containing protein [Oscillospiraceae bacterium]|nr:helix-turn-helix domain-containing protein [Oscillospiraceae bacterium]
MNNLPLSYIGAKHDYLKRVPIVLGFKCSTFYTFTGLPHIHDCAEIWYALRGKSIHKVGDETFIQTAGTCVVVPAFVPHDNKILKTDETPIFASINISDDALRECGYEHFSYFDKKILFDGKILPRFHKFSEEAHARADEIIHKLSSEFSALPDASFAVMLSLYTDFLKLLGGESYSFKIPKAVLKRTDSVLKASDYIIENLSEKITIKKLCEFSGMSRSRFCEYFSEITGLSPMNYLRYARMDKARSFFLIRGKSLEEITKIVGASDKAHLCRLFKSHFGMTPSEYQKQHQVQQQLLDLETRERISSLNLLYDFFAENENV